MDNELTALGVIFTETYYWITVVFMFFIHVGFCMYEVGASRRKNLQHTLMKNTMLIPLVTLGWFIYGWWIYFAFSNVPFNTGGFIDAPFALPWSELMAPHMGGTNSTDLVTADDAQAWARINGAFWAAFLLFSWTVASIVSGAVIERIRTGAFLIVAVLIGTFTWALDATWGWNPAGWMVQLTGYHDAYASGVIHAIGGGTALGVLIVLGPRIGRFGPNGEVRDIKPHNPWLITVGLFLIFAGFWGFYVACNIPFLDVGGADGRSFFSTVNIYLMPTTTSAIIFNFILSFSGGLMGGYMVSKGDPFWTYSGGLAGIIAASAGNDLYHPMQAFVIGGVGAMMAYGLHNWVTRRFKIDDAVGACAVHGYAGSFGVIIAGFMLWGYPAAAPVDGSMAPMFATEEGWPMINPLGNFIGAIIMFFVLGVVPGWIAAKILNAFGVLRVPREVELAGLDTHFLGDAYPYFDLVETDFEPIERGYMHSDS